MKTIELLRHTANDGDRLTEDGIAAAVDLGGRLQGGYAVAVSTGAQRATQTIACLLAGLGEPVARGVGVVARLRSDNEDRWRAAYESAGSGDLETLAGADPDFVREDSEILAGGLSAVFDLLEEGGRALVVGHSPTNEAAVYGLTGEMISSLGKGEGVVVRDTGQGYAVESFAAGAPRSG